MAAATQWPPHSAFYSTLKAGNLVSRDEYERARAEFNRRRALPETHREHWRSMIDYLQVSNVVVVVVVFLICAFSIIIRAMSSHLCERYNVHLTISIDISTSMHCAICHCRPWHCAPYLPIIRVRRRPFTRFRWRTHAFEISFAAKSLADLVCKYYLRV